MDMDHVAQVGGWSRVTGMVDSKSGTVI
jgi:hypothetical protein